MESLQDFIDIMNIQPNTRYFCRNGKATSPMTYWADAITMYPWICEIDGMKHTFMDDGTFKYGEYSDWDLISPCPSCYPVAINGDYKKAYESFKNLKEACNEQRKHSKLKPK